MTAILASLFLIDRMTERLLLQIYMELTAHAHAIIAELKTSLTFSYISRV
jgi:hypothetical protein